MSNPILNNRFIEQERILQSEPMTVNGTIQVTAFLGMLLIISAFFVWSRFSLGYTDIATTLTGIGGILGFVLGLIITFTRNRILIPIYSISEGLFLGGVSAIFASYYHGIVFQAVSGTFAALFSMLLLYKLNVIHCTDKFRSVIFISILSIAVVYLVDYIGHFFNYAVPIINSASNAGIAISCVIVAIAAFSLVTDFDFIERGAQNMLPKDCEWYGAFGLMVTMVWLYLEILKLLAKFNSRK